MKTLFDITEMNHLKLKNRFIRAAVGEKTKDGLVNEYILGIYRKLAQGGAGAIITGFTLVDEAEKHFPLLALYDDKFIDGHKELTTTVHEGKANIISQLVYVGSYIIGESNETITLAPSAVKHHISGVLPREISRTEIKSIQQKFAKASLRAQKSGYDGLEIHAAHWFLLSQFLSPYYNRRTDEYGGPIENRARILLETYEAIRQAVGTKFPIWAKINVNDGLEGGVTLADCLYACRELARRGIEAIEVSGDWQSRTGVSGAYFKDEAAAIYNETGLAVILTGGNRDYQEMTEILNNSGIAYFGLARPLIKDPSLINRFQMERI